jgi:DNA helicase-2/ATP-dependent DNA helicase PcrA
MDALDSSRGEADRSTHADDLAALEAVAALHPDASSFESWLRDVLARRPVSGPAVLLSTIHKIKGREWEHVIVYGASQGLFPHRLSDDEEGERRVFHVALTRAIRQVVVLADADECSPFVSELDGSRTRSPIVAVARAGRNPERAVPRGSVASTGTSRDHVRPGRPGADAGKRGPRRLARPTPEVPAAVGLALEYAGHSGTLVDLSESEAVLQVGAARLRVAFGSEVRVQGATVVLTGPGETKGVKNSAEPFESALREWRSEAAKRASVPAYVVLNDSELAGIAARQPKTLAELAHCKGIGPIRLDRWGDEMLAALTAADGD